MKSQGVLYRLRVCLAQNGAWKFVASCCCRAPARQWQHFLSFWKLMFYQTPKIFFFFFSHNLRACEQCDHDMWGCNLNRLGCCQIIWLSTDYLRIYSSFVCIGIHMIDADVDDLQRHVVQASAFAEIALILCDNHCAVSVYAMHMDVCWNWLIPWSLNI